MHSSSEPASSSLLNAKPFLGRTRDSAYEMLEIERAKLAEVLNNGLALVGISGLLVQSAPRASECWVQMICWTPQNASRDRVIRRSVKITLHAHEFCRYPVEYRIHLSGDGRDRVIHSIFELQDDALRRLIQFATQPIVQLRNYHFHRFNPIKGGSLWEMLTLPRNKPSNVKRRFRAGWRRFWVAWLIVGISLVSLTFGSDWSLLGFALIVISVALRVMYPVILHKRGMRPLGEPRTLLKYDSWQTVVPDLGISASSLRQAVMTDLKDGRHESAWIEIEKIWNVGLDELVERDQIVLHFRRSMVFVEIHAYGSDLYVDWEAYLNFGVWSEVPFATGFEKGERAPVVFHQVQPSVQAFGEYDLSDANFALEWVHAVVKRHLKRLLAEHKIDEDIDFKIIREDRAAVRNAKPAEKKAKRQFSVGKQKA